MRAAESGYVSRKTFSLGVVQLIAGFVLVIPCIIQVSCGSDLGFYMFDLGCMQVFTSSSFRNLHQFVHFACKHFILSNRTMPSGYRGSRWWKSRGNGDAAATVTHYAVFQMITLAQVKMNLKEFLKNPFKSDPQFFTSPQNVFFGAQRFKKKFFLDLVSPA